MHRFAPKGLLSQSIKETVEGCVSMTVSLVQQGDELGANDGTGGILLSSL